MKPVQILLCILLIIFIPISLFNFIAKFVFSDCDAHLYFNQYDEFTNNKNISFYHGTFIASYVFSCANMIAFLFLSIYKLFKKSSGFKIIIILIAVVLCVNLTWLVFEAIILGRVSAELCFLRVTNIIESSLGLIYAIIITIIFSCSTEKIHRWEKVGHSYV